MFPVCSHIHDASAWPACVSFVWLMANSGCFVCVVCIFGTTNNTFLFGRQWLCERRRLRLVKDQGPHVFLLGDMLTTMMWFNIDYIWVGAVSGMV